MPNIVPASIAFKFASDWIPRLGESLLQQRKARLHEIDQMADIFGDPIELGNFYIEPHCQQFNPADDDEEEARYVVREPIFSRLQHFFGGATVTGGNQLFVLADAGMGKTSLLMMLKMAYVSSFWPKAFECILLKLGPDSLTEINKITSRRNKILLLDALDEDPSSWGRITQYLTQLLAATRTFRRVVITCRTQFFSGNEDPFNRRGQVSLSGYVCPVIYLSLFDEEQVEEYLKKRFPGAKDSIHLAKRMLAKIRSLRCRPMLLAHIEDMLQSESTAWSEFSIYEALIKTWLQREQRKMGERQQAVAPTINDLWSACRFVSVELHRRGKRELDEESLNIFIKLNPLIHHIPTMDIGGRSLLNKNSKGEFRFSHYSIQEFMIADSVIRGLEGNALGQIRPTDQSIAFILQSQDYRNFCLTGEA